MDHQNKPDVALAIVWEWVDRTMHDYYVSGVKQPEQSRGPWDLYTLLDTIPGAGAFCPVAAGGCPRLLQ